MTARDDAYLDALRGSSDPQAPALLRLAEKRLLKERYVAYPYNPDMQEAWEHGYRYGVATVASGTQPIVHNKDRGLDRT